MRRRRGRYDLSDPASLEDPIVDIRQDGDGEMRALGIEATLSMKMNVYSEVETEILKICILLTESAYLRKKKAFMRKCLCTIRQNVRLRSV